jgi:parallel beta-helix repeat protein
MENMLWRRGLVFGIIVLLVGSVFLPCFSGNMKNTSVRATGSHRAVTGKNIIYVDDDSPSPGNGSWVWPYCQIQYAIDNASEGDEINVCNGSYIKNGPVCLIDKQLNLYAGGDDPHGNDNQYPPIINANSINDTIFVIADNVTIKGFNITGSGGENTTDPASGNLYYTYSGIRVHEDNQNCIISNNIIYHNGVGVRSYRYMFIHNNIVYDNFDDGIKIRAGRIENNYIIHNGRQEPGNQGDGIEIYAVGGIQIINNTIIDNHLDGIWDDTGDRHIITGNTIKNNHQCGIDFYEAMECTIKNNIISNGYVGIFINVSSSNSISNNTLSNNSIGIWFSDSSSNSIENNMISYNTNRGIYLEASSVNKIIKNFIWYNKVGILDYKSSNNYMNGNDFRENSMSIELIFSVMDTMVFNNIVSTSKMKLRAIASIAFAPMNWWGDWRGPWLNMIRIAFVIVFPWSPIEFPINSASIRYLRNSYPQV